MSDPDSHFVLFDRSIVKYIGKKGKEDHNLKSYWMIDFIDIDFDNL